MKIFMKNIFHISHFKKTELLKTEENWWITLMRCPWENVQVQTSLLILLYTCVICKLPLKHGMQTHFFRAYSSSNSSSSFASWFRPDSYVNVIHVISDLFNGWWTTTQWWNMNKTSRVIQPPKSLQFSIAISSALTNYDNGIIQNNKL